MTGEPVWCEFCGWYYGGHWQGCVMLAHQENYRLAGAAGYAELVAERDSLALQLQAAQAALAEVLAEHTATVAELAAARALVLDIWEGEYERRSLNHDGTLKAYAGPTTRKLYAFLWPEGKPNA